MIRLRLVTGYEMLVNPDAITVMVELEPQGRGTLAQNRTLVVVEDREFTVSNSLDNIEAKIAAAQP